MTDSPCIQKKSLKSINSIQTLALTPLLSPWGNDFILSHWGVSPPIRVYPTGVVFWGVSGHETCLAKGLLIFPTLYSNFTGVGVSSLVLIHLVKFIPSNEPGSLLLVWRPPYAADADFRSATTGSAILVPDNDGNTTLTDSDGFMYRCGRIPVRFGHYILLELRLSNALPAFYRNLQWVSTARTLFFICT